MARTRRPIPPNVGYKLLNPPTTKPGTVQASSVPPTVLPSGNIPQPGTPYIPDESGPAAPAPDTGGGGGGPTTDWATSFFGGFGLPPDVVAQVNKIFAQYSDVNAASAAALAYIRGTPWYAQTYPGINEGIQKGLISNEADYRNLLNQQSQLYKQYLGRDITGAEFASNLGEGVNLSTIGGRLQGAALVGTYGADWRYTLGAFDEAGMPTDAETKALGEETAGLDSALGQQVKRRLDLANQRFAGIFRGQLAPPSLSTASGRLSAPGLSPTGGAQADVAA